MVSIRAYKQFQKKKILMFGFSCNGMGGQAGRQLSCQLDLSLYGTWYVYWYEIYYNRMNQSQSQLLMK